MIFRVFIYRVRKREKNINVVPKDQCTGCGVCITSCMHKCISLKRDELGFIYPEIEEENCTHCGQCQKCCPSYQFNKNSLKKEVTAYSVVNRDNGIRLQSSSGGAFFALGYKLIDQDNEKENQLKAFNIENMRNYLHIQLLKYHGYGVKIEDLPDIKGGILVYGAGKQLELCTEQGFIGFIDRSPDMHMCNGFPVYHLNDQALINW